MIILSKYEDLEYGINNDGDLFLGNDCSGYCMPDTPENRKIMEDDFQKEMNCRTVLRSPMADTTENKDRLSEKTSTYSHLS